MQYTTDCQARYLDLQRDLAWVNSEAWKFEHPRAQQRHGYSSPSARA
jgi:hypothetical protein